MLTLRRKLLSEGATVQAVRAQEFTIAGRNLVPTGRSLVRDVGLPGLSKTQRDHPHVSLQLSLGFVQGQGGRVRYRLGGVPDAQVVGGEAAFSVAYRADLARYLTGLGAWGSIVRIRTGLPRFKIREITDLNVLSGKAPLAGFAVNDWVRIDRIKLTSGKVVGGFAKVLATNLPATISLAFWPNGAGTGGSVGKYQRGFVPFDASRCRFVRILRRAVGRPFVRLRGRRSRR